MASAPSLDELWNSVRPREDIFEPRALADCPDPARRYLMHANQPGAPLATAVHLSMDGEIKLGRWMPFEAEQVLVWDRGFIWQAVVRTGVTRIRGFDSLLDGRSLMRWKLFGLIPVVDSAGPDIDRSAVGRFAAECVWLPSALVSHAVEWHEDGPTDVSATLPVATHSTDVTLSIGSSGELQSVSLDRWGQLNDGEEFSLMRFGGLVEEEKSYEGYTIPSKLRAGWHFGSDRFESKGEFFRCQVRAAEFK